MGKIAFDPPSARTVHRIKVKPKDDSAFAKSIQKGKTNRFRSRYANHEDVSALKIPQDTIVEDDEGRFLLGYFSIPKSFRIIGAELSKQKASTSQRSGGMPSTSVVWGNMPRRQGRQPWCRKTKPTNQHPALSEAMDQLGGWVVEHLYKEYAPGLFNEHRIQADRIRSEWTMQHAYPFTSAISNHNNRLPYHYDRGNTKRSMSAMAVWKREVQGGELVIPSLDLAVPCEDSTMTIFMGQDLLHGVTKIKERSKSSYRISLVWYTMEQLWHCLEPGEELRRYREIRTELEVRQRKENRNSKAKR